MVIGQFYAVKNVKDALFASVLKGYTEKLGAEFERKIIKVMRQMKIERGE